MENLQGDSQKSERQQPPGNLTGEQVETKPRHHKAVAYERPLIDRRMKYTLYALLIAAILLLFFMEPLIHIIQGWGNT